MKILIAAKTRILIMKVILSEAQAVFVHALQIARNASSSIRETGAACSAR